MARRKPIKLHVTERLSLNGHPINIYVGPVRQACVMLGPNAAIFRCGYNEDLGILTHGTVHPVDEYERLRRKARRYARRRT